MLRSAVVVALAFLSPACGLQRFPLPISELAKQVRGNAKIAIEAAPKYPAYKLDVPIDHFHNDSKYEPHSNGTFGLRYWFDAQYYQPGGPVFVLGGGETDGEGRLPFLEKGIVYEIAKATKGVGVILEHRYYGDSIPVDSFSTEDLRFLTTEQALADTAYFAKNVVFEGLEDVDWSPEKTPWIAYGGSYAGAFVAFLRVVYPDVFHGAISSSGVPEAIWDYWEYFEGARLFAASPACSETTGKLTNVVDNILLNETNSAYVGRLKTAFGLSGIRNNADFASAINGGIYSLQSYNWDPEISSDEFFRYCDIVSSDEVLYPEQESKREEAEELIKVAGWGDELDPLLNRFLNYIGYVDETVLASCNGDQNACFGTDDVSFYAEDDLSQTWRLWIYQVCTEWGYLQTGSGYPEDILPMISRTIDLEYSSAICKSAFNFTEPANVDAINKYGGFDIAYERLAFVDGEWDPWRAAGVQAVHLPKRESTTSEPVILIDGAVHHWDENGVYPNETTPNFPPKPVQAAKKDIREFTLAWLEEWKPS